MGPYVSIGQGTLKFVTRPCHTRVQTFSSFSRAVLMFMRHFRGQESLTYQKAQLSQRKRAMLYVI